MKNVVLFLVSFLIGMVSYCQTNVVTKFDSTIYKFRNGITETVRIFKYTEIDTVYITNGNGDTTGFSIDTNTYDAINLCLGDSIRISCYGLYNGVRNPNNDRQSLANWSTGDGTTIDYGQLTQVITYTTVGCYDITASIVSSDSITSMSASVRVRIAENPVRRVYDFPAICSSDSLLLNVGYDNDAFIQLKDIEFAESVTKEYAVKTFIPDGMNQCATNCFTADVTFNEFPQGRTIMSADDICSVCIDMEHSFMGDYRMTLVCPTGQTAILKYGTKGSGSNCDPLCPANAPDGSYGGSGQYLGIPYGGSSDSPYDNLNRNYCDSINNMYGEGLMYCFSRNGDYTFASGRSADINPLISADYIANTDQAYKIQYTDHAFQTIPAPYINAGTTAQNSTFWTKRPSDHDNKSDYYAPAEDFSNLIGCPLNGNWQIQICDFWPADNGWIFSWNMDICGVSNGSCEYQVGVDTVIWSSDEHLNFRYQDSLNAYISSRDTSGTFPMYMSIYDNFGCTWIDTMNINIVQMPEPILPDDTSLCQSDSLKISCADRHPQYTYTYMWEPNGETESSVYAKGLSEQVIKYVVEETNTRFNISCSNRDSMLVTIKKQPRLSFDPGIYPLEGCEPLRIDIDNQSANVDKIMWNFGDGESSTEYMPTHYYKAGTYSLYCYAVSSDGCYDSLKYDSVITVYSSPEARFSWEPTYPTITNPSIQLSNQSLGDDVSYRWEIAYDKDYPYSYHTLTEFEPTFKWVVDNRDISGEYIVRLIAFTSNIGPSGNKVVCSDTTENTVLLVNDFLQFPNVVTPNGDGINDVFEIKNLLSGAYPTNSLWIYNKLGVEVYHVENISKEDDFWDPNKSNSIDGTYFFRFSGKGYNGSVERNGAIEVLR